MARTVRPGFRHPDAGVTVRSASGERGDVAPLVVLTPLTVFLVLFVVQLGLFFHARTVLNAAVQDAARAGQLEGATDADARDALDQILAGSTSLLTVTSFQADVGPTTVSVTASADVLSVVPFWSGSTSAAASGPKEVFRPEDER